MRELGPHETMLSQQIETVAPNAFRRLETLPELSEEQATRIAIIILGFACQAQSDGSIRAGRKAFARIPREWRQNRIAQLVNEALDLTDEWEYRRLLELLLSTLPDVFRQYVSMGLRSSDIEIAEAAKKFSAINPR